MSLMKKAVEFLNGSPEQQRATLADRLAAAQTELDALAAEHRRLALAAEEGDQIAAKRIEQSREQIAKLRQRAEHLQAAMVAHEERAAVQAARERAANREIFEAEAREALGNVRSAASVVDARIAALADALTAWVDACEHARPYLSDEGKSSLYRATRYLEPCILYRLRGLPGIPGSPELTDERRETWTQYAPSADDYQRLIAKGDK